VLLFPIADTPGIDLDQKRLRCHARGPQMPLLLAKKLLHFNELPGAGQGIGLRAGTDLVLELRRQSHSQTPRWPYDLMRAIPKFRG
jgi:hypothetical protein